MVDMSGSYYSPLDSIRCTLLIMPYYGDSIVASIPNN
jgi:hypothetical protein